LIEWPDRLGPLLPRHRLEILFEFDDQPEARRAIIAGDATWQARLTEIAAHA
jgi:tRNA threonylcarbamoyladenosine biosynthesis protein TsaE